MAGWDTDQTWSKLHGSIGLFPSRAGEKHSVTALILTHTFMLDGADPFPPPITLIAFIFTTCSLTPTDHDPREEREKLNGQI